MHSARHQGPVNTFRTIQTSHAGEHQACITIIGCSIDGAHVLFSSLIQLSCIVYSSCMVKGPSVKHRFLGLLDQACDVHSTGCTCLQGERLRGCELPEDRVFLHASCTTLRIVAKNIENRDGLQMIIGMDAIMPDKAIDLLCRRTIHVWYFSTNCRR